MKINNVCVIGRVIGKKRKKRIFFIYIENPQGKFQFVIKNNECLSQQFYRVGEGDIIRCIGIIDAFQTERFGIEFPSFLAKDIEIVNKRIMVPNVKIDKTKIEEYAQAKNRIRQFLSQKEYLEVAIPVLTNGETSSLAKSFVTESCSGDILFLRKTMDVFLRMYSCLDFHKVYSIGPCFRNCYPTQKSVSEFEMLSIFTNYQSLEDAIVMVDQLIKLVLRDSPTIQRIELTKYEKMTNKNGLWLITGFKDEKNSYARVDDNGFTEEFKLKINGITVAHGVMELPDIDSYKIKIESQGKKKDYGELLHLEELLMTAAPPCFNIGFSIIRALTVYNNGRMLDYDCFSISRLNRSLSKRKRVDSE